MSFEACKLGGGSNGALEIPLNQGTKSIRSQSMKMHSQSGNQRSLRWLGTGLSFLALLIMLGAGAVGASARTQPADGQPQLIDRELFFGDPEIVSGQISPDGQFIAFIKPYKGTRNVWVKRTSEPFSAARPITNETTRPIPGYFWSRDGKYILFVQDKGGDENYNVYAVNPSETPAAGQVPTARNLTDLKGARAEIFAAPKIDP